MAWEQRKNGREYYYRAVRKGARVTKIYLGAGEKGRKAAEADQAARDARRQAARMRNKRDEGVDDLMIHMDEFDKLFDQLVTCQLLCDGWKKHHRQWRATYGRSDHRGS